MRLDMNRICQLAGIKGNTSSKMLREGAEHKAEEGMHYESLDEEDVGAEEAEEGMHYESLDEEDEEDEDKQDEMVEIDEVMLVQELRRAKRLMNESKKRKFAKQERLDEMKLKAIIDQEVKNVIKDLQLNSGWMYGNKKPTRSKKGYTHQGSFLKGMGFK
jgi:hypothetical protein